MSDYFKAMGILFPEGAKVELDNVKGVLAARLTHDQALRVIQIINAFIGDSSGKLTKEVFGAGELNKSPLKDD